MEILISSVLIIAMLIVLGVSPYYILAGLLVIMLLILAATFLFFVYSALTLIRSHRVTGHFLRIDKPGKGFPSAVYDTPEGELRNTFPCEMIFQKALYKPERVVMMLVTRKGRVYDRYSIITIVLGLILSSISVFVFGGKALTVLI